MSKTCGFSAEKVLEKFNGSSPLVPQILIGLGSVLIRPLTILANKKEDNEKKVSTAARIFATELIALPLALGAAAAAGKLGRKVCKNEVYKNGTKAIFETTGFIIANFMIPPIATFLLHKYPIKEKIASLVSGKKGKKAVVKPETNLQSTPIQKLDIHNKKRIDNNDSPNFGSRPGFAYHSGRMRV